MLNEIIKLKGLDIMNENENNEVIQTEEDINRLMQVRIDKLKELQEAGKDPF